MNNKNIFSFVFLCTIVSIFMPISLQAMEEGGNSGNTPQDFFDQQLQEIRKFQKKAWEEEQKAEDTKEEQESKKEEVLGAEGKEEVDEIDPILIPGSEAQMKLFADARKAVEDAQKEREQKRLEEDFLKNLLTKKRNRDISKPTLPEILSTIHYRHDRNAVWLYMCEYSMVDSFFKSNSKNLSWFERKWNKLLFRYAWYLYTGGKPCNYSLEERSPHGALLNTLESTNDVQRVRLFLEHGVNPFYIDAYGNDAFSILSSELTRTNESLNRLNKAGKQRITDTEKNLIDRFDIMHAKRLEYLYQMRALLRKALIEQIIKPCLLLRAKGLPLEVVVHIINSFGLSEAVQAELQAYLNKFPLKELNQPKQDIVVPNNYWQQATLAMLMFVLHDSMNFLNK